MIDLSELDRLHAAAEDGVWEGLDNLYVETNWGLRPIKFSPREWRAIAALHNAYPELSAELKELRKRCEQLERLVCESVTIGPDGIGKWMVVFGPRHGYHMETHDTQQAAIDAAIKHLAELPKN